MEKDRKILRLRTALRCFAQDDKTGSGPGRVTGAVEGEAVRGLPRRSFTPAKAKAAFAGDPECAPRNDIRRDRGPSTANARSARSALRMTSLAVLLVLTFGAAGAWGQANVKQIADGVDHRYNDLRSMSAEFTEHYSGNGMERTESGTVSFKKPGKMRWQYENPRPKLFVSDGKLAWFYVPGEKQARQAQVKKLDDLRTPLRYLLGHTKLEKEFTGLSVAPDVKPVNPENIVLRGVPPSMADRVSQVLLEITPEHRIARIVVDELDGSTTEFSFRDEKDNPAMPDSSFEFRPPAGVEVLQGSELTAP